jgi:lipoprotein-anchoring transpeptidase ErfK/SrfK
MTNANPIGALKKPLRWLILAGATSTATLYPAANAFAEQQLLPFGMTLPSLDGRQDVDPRTAITVEAVGIGTHLAKAELRDGNGELVAEASDQTRIVFDRPLAFGTRYTIKVTAERSWLGQSETRELSFTTVTMPKLEGSTVRTLGQDASVTLHFDQPVGELQAKSELPLTATPDASHQNIRLTASGDYTQDKTYPVELNWQTATGVSLPPLALELTTAPPLNAEINVKGLTNLGLALPLRVKFSEEVADRAEIGSKIQLRTADGQAVAGRWSWITPHQVQFTPQPSWPASSTVQVNIEPQALRSVRGGSLDKPFSTHFTTGADRHLFVYLDAQRVDAVENGQIVRSFRVSTGKPKTPTVTGNFYIYDRYRYKTMRSDVPKGQKGYYEVKNVPYTQFFHKDYAFHGATWHNGFGHPASHGCVNMATKDHNTRWPNVPEDAGWLFQWAALGVPVTVTHGAAPAKPAANQANKPEEPTQPSAKLDNAGDLMVANAEDNPLGKPKEKPKAKPVQPDATAKTNAEALVASPLP